MSQEDQLKEYRYRYSDANGHTIECGVFEWKRVNVIGSAVSEEDACRIVAELNRSRKWPGRNYIT